MSAPNSRNDVAQRRRWLREFDIALLEELDDGGSSTFQSLRDQATDRALLSARASDESLWEWWHYAQRRRIIEPGAHRDEMSLSDRGRARLEEVQRDALSPSTPKAQALMRYLIPPGLTGLVAVAVSVLSRNDVAGLVALGAIAVALLCWLEAVAIDWIWAKWLDPRARPALLRKAVAWLEGDEVRLLGRLRYPAVEKSTIRRLPTPAMPKLTAPPVPGVVSNRAEATPTDYTAPGNPSSTSLSSSTD